ncbi:MAG: hypothetical protein WC528_00780 [Patescibacteria group bacterium]
MRMDEQFVKFGRIHGRHGKGLAKYRRRKAFCLAHAHWLGQTGVEARAWLMAHKIPIPPDPQAKKAKVKPSVPPPNNSFFRSSSATFAATGRRPEIPSIRLIRRFGY